MTDDIDSIAGVPGDAAARSRQVAALAWRRSGPGVDVLLVTSRNTRRWLLPKGWLVAGKSSAESAMVEAFEEAGVRGVAADQPLGSYHYDKVLKDGSLRPCKVDVFAIPVVKLLDEWPEMGQRRRRWYSALTAASMVAEPDLAEILSAFHETRLEAVAGE
jgi:8-oxo-dGTP pyrophosphatase MutT (NUDIX family)